MASACRRFGISRETGYKWWRRYEEGGEDALLDRSRAPRRHPNETPDAVVNLVLRARTKHPFWGARKLIAWLERKQPDVELPAPSTVAAILKRHGLVAPRRRRRRAAPTGHTVGDACAPNEIWATDFKGEFKTRDGRYCYPLTLQDYSSRLLLRCQGLRATAASGAQPIFKAAFREYGVPRAILSDNGSPFASASFSGLTPLSAWWLRLGITLMRIEPGHPEQNGRLERLHKTLKRETTEPPGGNLGAQQRRFNRFRDEFNNERPHEALNNATPSSCYVPSPRAYPETLPSPTYEPHVEVRRLNPNGEVHFKGYRFTISKALRHDDIAFAPVDDGVWRVLFYRHQLGTFDERSGVVARAGFAIRAKPGWRRTQ